MRIFRRGWAQLGKFHAQAALQDSYGTIIPLPKIQAGLQTANLLNNLVREAGLEPARLLRHRILSPGRLPIPPLPQKENRRGEI